MNAPDSTDWLELNQACLSAELAVLRGALERYATNHSVTTASGDPDASLADSQPAPLLQHVTKLFGLSPFERSLLLLCAGVELDGHFGALCATLQGDSRRALPTFSLALEVLPGAHWSALTPEAPLRNWRLIELLPGEILTQSPLRIDERILHYLVGVSSTDARLRELLRPLAAVSALPPSQGHIAQRIAALWSADASEQVIRAVGLWGPEQASKHAILAAACADCGWSGQVMRAADLPLAPAERQGLLRLWRREALLTDSVLVLDDHDSASASLHAVLDELNGPLAVLSREPVRGSAGALVGLDVSKPNASEQATLWRHALGSSGTGLHDTVDVLIGQFDLDPAAIAAAAADARVADTSDTVGIDGTRALWRAAQRQARPRLDELAEHIEPSTDWDGLVLPMEQKRLLQEIVASVRQRYKVYETWGMAANGKRGLGVATLFAGASGTGKTLAAEVIASALSLGLYRIDLSSVVSKYIGETEKNLRRVFDAAEQGGAVLLFDEADALFGKRSDVRDSHDRYANIEVSYLLQRMESYRGLAILTTNMKNALDSAFLRRLRFVVQFPFPDAAMRAEIWRRVYPASTPTEALDPAKLARLHVAGGNIRNIALNAAFLAADAGEPVRMTHMLRAARGEYAKLDQSLGETEVRGWL
jgi:ATP-dependent 26S proteasome regulatory subunit